MTEVIVHHEETADQGFCWWAEAPGWAGFSAVADSEGGLRRLVAEAFELWRPDEPGELAFRRADEAGIG